MKMEELVVVVVPIKLQAQRSFLMCFKSKAIKYDTWV